jgi:hypothetical protein
MVEGFGELGAKIEATGTEKELLGVMFLRPTERESGLGFTYFGGMAMAISMITLTCQKLDTSRLLTRRVTRRIGGYCQREIDSYDILL